MDINFALVSTAAAIGLAGGVHCVAMCGSPSVVAVPAKAIMPFQVGRITGYSVLGAIAALGAAGFAEVATNAAWLRPFWIMMHAAMLLLGGWMLVTGKHPAWLQQFLLDAARNVAGRVSNPALAVATPVPAGAMAGATSTGRGSGSVERAGQAMEVRLPARIGYKQPAWKTALRGFLTGMAWALLPCGLLYSAVMLAWMSGSVATGALAMAAFAAVSGVQLWLGQRGLLALLRAGKEATAIRIAGIVTLAGAGLLLWWAAAGHAPEGFCLPGF